MAYYAFVTTTLATLALVAIPAALLLGGALAAPASRERLVGFFAGRVGHPLAWAWFVAALAMAGSLYLSDVAGLAPCLFCWYQRICMYPLVLVLGVAVLRGDAGAWRYAVPLAAVGAAIAAYHVSIQFRPAVEPTACAGGVPCSARYLAIYGFVSIPVMAGAAFLLILALLMLVRAVEADEERAIPGQADPPAA